MATSREKLPEHVQAFIVDALACYDTPSQVVAAVLEEFGLAIRRQKAESYHPERFSGRDLSKKWRDRFAATRKKFLRNVGDIPIAQRSYRLRQLQHLLDQARSMRNPGLARELLVDGAREVGDVHTNRQKVDHDVGDGLAEILKLIDGSTRGIPARKGR
jgi:hypothetical protein